MTALSFSLLALAFGAAFVLGDNHGTTKDTDDLTTADYFHEYRKFVQRDRQPRDCITSGEDYPNYTHVPTTNFTCDGKLIPGFYADEDTGCQVYHVCLEDGRRESLICPKTTIYDQSTLICDNWAEVNCLESSAYYEVNARFSQPQSSSSEQVSLITHDDLVIAARRVVVDTILHMFQNSIIRRDSVVRALDPKHGDNQLFPYLPYFLIK